MKFSPVDKVPLALPVTLSSASGLNNTGNPGGLRYEHAVMPFATGQLGKADGLNCSTWISTKPNKVVASRQKSYRSF